jgi:hypothetical protein
MRRETRRKERNKQEKTIRTGCSCTVRSMCHRFRLLNKRRDTQARSRRAEQKPEQKRKNRRDARTNCPFLAARAAAFRSPAPPHSAALLHERVRQRTRKKEKKRADLVQGWESLAAMRRVSQKRRYFPDRPLRSTDRSTRREQAPAPFPALHRPTKRQKKSPICPRRATEQRAAGRTSVRENRGDTKRETQ